MENIPGSSEQRGPTQTPFRHLILQILLLSLTPTTPTNWISWMFPIPGLPPFTVSKMSGEGAPLTRTSGDAQPTLFLKSDVE